MTLVKSKECKQDVASSEKARPHCGVKGPGVRNRDMIIGFAVLVLIGCIIARCSFSNNSKEASRQDANTMNEAAQTSDASESAVRVELPQTFTEASSTEKQWPKAASVSFQQSVDEKKFLADQTCLDETSCYGPMRFRKYIFKRYPDIAKVVYHPTSSEASDSEMIELRKEQFYQSLYFAKQIQLANGQSLYDFMQSCSSGFTSLDAAEPAYDEKTKTSYFDIRYFPTLRQANTGKAVELQILFERRGDQLIATSPLFTSNVLRHADFLQRHHVTCRNSHATEASGRGL